jgi:hypothetical protein
MRWCPASRGAAARACRRWRGLARAVGMCMRTRVSMRAGEVSAREQRWRAHGGEDGVTALGTAGSGSGRARRGATPFIGTKEGEVELGSEVGVLGGGPFGRVAQRRGEQGQGEGRVVRSRDARKERAQGKPGAQGGLGRGRGAWLARWCRRQHTARP